MHHPTDRITHTTAFVAPIVEHWLEREIAQWVHPMKLIQSLIKSCTPLQWINNLYFTQDELDITLLEEDETQLSYLSPWKSPVMLKVAVIFMFTQLTTVFLSECSGMFLDRVSWLPFAGAIWPREIILGRILQIAAANCFYMWRLYRADDWTWSEWLTSEDGWPFQAGVFLCMCFSD